MRLAITTLLAFVLIVAVAVGFPPLEITGKTQDTITLGGLHCGNKYRIKVSERNDGKWTDARTKKRNTEPCPTEPPPTGGFPDASNTGPTGALTVHTSPIVVRTNGAVIENVQAPYIEVAAADVTIRNSRFGGPGRDFPVYSFAATRLTIEDSEIIGDDGTCVWGNGGVTVRRTELRGCENGFDAASDMTVVDSWIHDLDTTNDAHTDGIQMGSGVGNVLIRHNTIDPQNSGTPASTSAIIMYTKDGAQNHDVRIENNLLQGSHTAFTLYAPRFPASNIYINDNRFTRGVYGYTDGVQVGRTVTEFNGNVDAITGAPIPTGGSCGTC